MSVGGKSGERGRQEQGACNGCSGRGACCSIPVAAVVGRFGGSESSALLGEGCEADGPHMGARIASLRACSFLTAHQLAQSRLSSKSDETHF